jgi:nitrate/TMAO reductase-like tetraheme cytochrome c subunit
MASVAGRLLKWVNGLSRGWLLAGASVLGLSAILASIGMYRVYDYVQHDNDFCVSCHLMAEPFARFQRSAHRELACKACHRPNMVERSKMALTQVLETPDSITHHAVVPRETCGECHVNGNPDQWKQIANSVGHRVHLESKNPNLKNVECVDCHAAGIHEFAPVDRTCGQVGCHENISVRLGKMSNLTIHCTSCHDFSKPVSPELRGKTLTAEITPRGNDCFSCHAMRERATVGFPDDQAHNAVCGSCHNPHNQTTPAEAVRTCTAGGCHARVDTVSAMHRGLGAGVMQNCIACHKAHTWKVAADACTGCHAPDALDGGAPIKRINGKPERMSIAGAALLPIQLSIALLGQMSSLNQPFEHKLHKTVACKTCHETADGHGVVKTAAVSNCGGCHHSARNVARCTACHAVGKLTRTFTRTFDAKLSVADTPRPKALTFAHSTHNAVDCRSCHKNAARMRAVTSCTSCHEDHHTELRTCTTCHSNVNKVKEHNREVHLTCTGSGCHQTTVDGSLQTQRNVCLTCHTDQVDHEPAGDCANCHMISTKSRNARGSQ